MSPTQPLSRIVAASGAVLGLAGYVYLIGAAVLWARLNQAGLPTEVPVSIAIRPELAVLGAETLAVWVGFIGVILLLLGSAMRVRRQEVRLAVACGVFGTGVGVALWAQ